MCASTVALASTVAGDAVNRASPRRVVIKRSLVALVGASFAAAHPALARRIVRKDMT
jgi:hypothetical protein